MCVGMPIRELGYYLGTLRKLRRYGCQCRAVCFLVLPGGTKGARLMWRLLTLEPPWAIINDSLVQKEVLISPQATIVANQKSGSRGKALESKSHHETISFPISTAIGRFTSGSGCCVLTKPHNNILVDFRAPK